jgi:hypothetical protein
MRGDLEVHLDRLVLVIYLLQLAKGYAAFCFFQATLVSFMTLAIHCGVIASIFRIGK